MKHNISQLSQLSQLQIPSAPESSLTPPIETLPPINSGDYIYSFYNPFFPPLKMASAGVNVLPLFNSWPAIDLTNVLFCSDPALRCTRRRRYLWLDTSIYLDRKIKADTSGARASASRQACGESARGVCKAETAKGWEWK